MHIPWLPWCVGFCVLMLSSQLTEGMSGPISSLSRHVDIQAAKLIWREVQVQKVNCPGNEQRLQVPNVRYKSYMRKLFRLVLAQVFTGSSFRLFASIAAHSGVVLVNMWQYSAWLTIWLWTPDAAVHEWFSQHHVVSVVPAQVCMSAVWSILYCAVWPSQCHQLEDLVCQREGWYTCSWLVAEGHSLVHCVCASECESVLSGSPAAPRENKCQVRCQFQTVLHSHTA